MAIRGFEIRNFQTNSDSLVPGIGITGASQSPDITVISKTAFTNIVNLNTNGNAYGIEIHGTSTNQTITNLVVRNNELFNLKTGWSESMTVERQRRQFRRERQCHSRQLEHRR